MTTYNVIAQGTESTVVAEYEPIKDSPGKYQSEHNLEIRFIKDLTEQGYTFLRIKSEADLIANLREQLQLLNDYTFSDSEWKRFFKEAIANENDGILEKTRKIQQDHVQILRRDDGTTKNIYLLDKKNIHNNRLQVLNQYEENSGNNKTRYDVTILVNGLPLVHVELKRRGVAIREAFNQIKRYQRDSFWAGCGLYEYVQVFVISNGTNTKYYSNTTRDRHIKEFSGASVTRSQSKKTSNSFEFTSYWADAQNNIISDLRDFTRTFFARHSILNILTRFCVFTEEQALLVMRPYQIAATEKILSRIEIATNYKKYGTVDGGGYIWHTTGSGKTLTSFKTAQLASKLPYIDKVLFVVDRKDLDYQTMREYDRFEKGAANSNTSTRVLQKQLEDRDSKIIITTIQKLGTFIKKNPKHESFQKHMVLIFDECHRSQFGQMHSDIVKNFKKYHLFGFTGTPIFAANANAGGDPTLKTTEQAFGKQLHTYTIINAINDGNVLPFRIDYIQTIQEKEKVRDKKIYGIDTERLLLAPERVEKVVKYILEYFDKKTRRSHSYMFKGKRVMGFNSLFAVQSIPAAMAYYTEFKRQLKESGRQLKIATIYSFGANEEDPEDRDGFLGEEGFEPEQLDQTSRDFLEKAIQDYNETFKTNFDTSSSKFESYYKDLSLRMKNREVDLVIVVNMFLTGFDSTTLNTLWVDKNLKMHGLIQAYSRTNRILNSVKAYGNIVCFRKLDEATDKALALFGNKDARGIVLLKRFEDYYNGYKDGDKSVPGYADIVRELFEKFPLGIPIIGEGAEKEFIRLFGTFLRIRNILTAFDEFDGKELITEGERQNFQSTYYDLYDKWKKKAEDKEDVVDDVVFELELVRHDEVNIDYILQLIEKYRESLCKDKAIVTSIQRAIGASPDLRSKKELIETFIAKINPQSSVTEEWPVHVRDAMEHDLEDIIEKERLKPEKAKKFVTNAFRDGALRTTGTDLDAILPAVSIFAKNKSESRSAKRESVITRLKAYFDKFCGLI